MDERLLVSDTADDVRAWWRVRVAALKPLLEGGGLDARNVPAVLVAAGLGAPSDIQDWSAGCDRLPFVREHP